ncbi:hypothetical protein RE6C_04613 [Rhodopirellula europaea 6C]|uniref:Uncharacterized protein n=1 Tax=Rhodopirellula europaea 6C TaxID=1263867 RepID=M2A4S1_9BACT|nr:hypothetical protein RE6C_04613 [Rhodopirellula europaea 6C]
MSGVDRRLQRMHQECHPFHSFRCSRESHVLMLSPSARSRDFVCSDMVVDASAFGVTQPKNYRS